MSEKSRLLDFLSLCLINECISLFTTNTKKILLIIHTSTNRKYCKTFPFDCYASWKNKKNYQILTCCDLNMSFLKLTWKKSSASSFLSPHCWLLSFTTAPQKIVQYPMYLALDFCSMTIAIKKIVRSLLVHFTWWEGDILQGYW